MVYICIPTTKERRPRLKECIDSIRDTANYSDYSIVVYENFQEGCQVAVRKMISGLGDSLCVIINDDMTAEQDFLKNAVEAYKCTFPNNDGLGSLNEKTLCNQIAIIQMAPASLLYNYIYKGYVHYGADDELAQIFQKKDKFLVIENSIINHIHPLYDKKNKRPDLLDETYNSSRERLFEKDRALFVERKKLSYGFTDLTKIELNVPDYITN